MGCKPTTLRSDNKIVNDSKNNLTNSSDNIDNNIEINWKAKNKTSVYHWWPMLQTYEDDEDPINNLYAEGGGLYKYDKLFNTNGIKYQKENYCISIDSERKDKNWAGFCDRAAMLSCLYEYPRRAVTVRVEGKETIFKTRDIEALMIIAADNSTRNGLSVFYGSRNNKNPKILTSTNEAQKKLYQIHKNEPLPLELFEILKRFSKEEEPFVMDIDNGNAVWNYSFDSIKVIREPINIGEYNLYKEGKNIIYRFIIESKAYPDKNLNILGCVNYHNNFIRQKWLSGKNPDFLWKDYPKLDAWRGRCKMNPNYNAFYIYQIYKQSLLDDDKILNFKV